MTTLLTVLVAALSLTAPAIGNRQNGGEPADAVLAPLEAALRASPDDLKAGNDYRQAALAVKQYDRAIAFFQKLVAAHPDAANAHLNFGFAYVDKIPDAGSITQVILANNALTAFSKSLDARPSWIGYYTRGNSYLFWPKIFNRTKLGIADLEEALRIQRGEPKRAYHVRVYIALGDGRWKMDEVQKAMETWKAGLAEFPGNAALVRRVEADEAGLKAIIDAEYDPARRVDTRLDDLWSSR